MQPPIILETRRFFIIDKPAGLATHPGPRTPESLENLLPAYQPGRPAPVAVHRLDRDTSGCLLLARNASALRRLSGLFADGEVRKLYWAIIENLPADRDGGMIDAPLAKISSRATGWRMQVDAAGKPARTLWRCLARRGAYALVAFRPQTGRTHQLRVHSNLLAPGAAIVGDPVYGRAHPAGMMLHARALSFTDPWDAQAKTAEAPCPGRFLECGFDAASAGDAAGF